MVVGLLTESTKWHVSLFTKFTKKLKLGTRNADDELLIPDRCSIVEVPSQESITGGGIR